VQTFSYGMPCSAATNTSYPSQRLDSAANRNQNCSRSSGDIVVEVRTSPAMMAISVARAKLCAATMVASTVTGFATPQQERPMYAHGGDAVEHAGDVFSRQAAHITCA
jgi:hypothetical protein